MRREKRKKKGGERKEGRREQGDRQSHLHFHNLQSTLLHLSRRVGEKKNMKKRKERGGSLGRRRGKRKGGKRKRDAGRQKLSFLQY